MKRRNRNRLSLPSLACVALGVCALLAEVSCAGPPTAVRGVSTARGATRGAIGGAAVGAISGGSAGRGAAAGAVIGGAAGRHRAVRRGW